VSESKGDRTVSPKNSWVAPDACTLPTAEQPLRVGEFDALFANHVADVERATPTQLRLTLTGPPDLVDQVAELTNRESSCCSFFAFTISTNGHLGEVSQVRLEVEVPTTRVDVLDALAERAAAATQTRPA